MLKIPDKITVQGKEWAIYRESAAPRRFRQAQTMLERGILGETHYPRDRVILLADGMTEEQTLVTFVHELLHVAIYASGSEILGAEGEERLVESVDSIWYDIILQLIGASHA